MLQLLALAATLVAVVAEGSGAAAPASATPTYLAAESGIRGYIECVTDHALEREPSGEPTETLAEAGLRHCISERHAMVEALFDQSISLGEPSVDARRTADAVATDVDEQLRKDTIRLIRGVRAKRT